MKSKLESLLQKEQLIAFSCLALIMLISWAYMLHMAWGMSGVWGGNKPGMLDALGSRGYFTFIYDVGDYDGGYDVPLCHAHDPDV